jgi:hypothetical protein
MKNLLASLILLTVLFSSCKKKPTPVAVDNTDYADSVIGNYSGTKVQSLQGTQQFYDANATLTVTKVAKNQVNIVYFYSPYTTQIFFNCSSQPQGWVNLTVTPGTYKTNTPNNGSFYFPASATSNPHGLSFSVQDNSGFQYSFYGKK